MALHEFKGHMEILKSFEIYVLEVLGIVTKLETLSKSELKNLPFFFNESYNFHKWCLQNRTFILMSPARPTEDITPAELTKQANLVAGHLSACTILLLPAMASFNRKRLIAYKTPFVVPGKQMYLPDILIDLREHFARQRERINKSLTPSAQALLLYCIINRKYDSLSTGEISDKLEYSRMTLNRAFDELESFALAKNIMQGRDKILRFEYKGRDLWDKALSNMRSPVKRQIFMKSFPQQKSCFRKAGISALSEKTMISGDEVPIYALGFDDYKYLVRNGELEEARFPEDAACAVEIWKYSPCILSGCTELVDILSLFLSMRDDPDERVQGELDSLMEEFKW